MKNVPKMPEVFELYAGAARVRAMRVEGVKAPPIRVDWPDGTSRVMAAHEAAALGIALRAVTICATQGGVDA